MFGFGGRAHAASLTLAWDAPSDQSVTGFMVYYGTQSGTYTNQVNAGYQTSLLLSNLADGGSYYLVVRSYDASGTLSAASNEVFSGVLTSPVSITCPVLTATSPDGNPVSVSYTGLTVSGGVSPITTSCAPPSGSSFSVGTTAFSCTATDSLGTSGSCSSTVTVTAAALPSPPQITCPVISSVTASNNKWATVTYNSPTVTGGLAPVTALCTPSSGSRFTIGTTTVTCTATDAAQQQASCTTTATVLPRR